MYSLRDYLWMIADDTRVSAYAAAIRSAVRHGDRVLELGAGFGFFSVIAARAGAARVDAVDTNPAIHLGPRLAAANDCADRIVFHQVDAARLTLDHRVDVIVGDLRGPTPLAGRSLSIWRDVRTRLLREGGIIIPAADTLFVAPSRLPAAVRRDVHPAYEQEGVVMAPIARVMDDTPFRCDIEGSDLIAPRRPWSRIDYRTHDSADVDGEVTWTIAESGTMSGLAVWFDTQLAEGVELSSAPGSATRVYRQLFLPLRAAIPLAKGDRLRVALAGHALIDQYVWEWRVFRTSADTLRERELSCQNSIAEMVIDPAELHRRTQAAAPTLGPVGGAVRSLLARIDGQASIVQLGEMLQRDCPDVFPDVGSATAFVREWTDRLGHANRGVLLPPPPV